MPDDENEARFLIKTFLIPGQERLEKKLDAVCAEQTDLRINNETVKAKVAHLEYQVVKTQETVERHRDDVEAHYKPYHPESLPQRLWRHKPEIAAGGTIGTAIATLVYLVLEKYLGG